MMHLLHKRAIGFCLYTLHCLYKRENPCNVGTCWEISPWKYFYYINHVQFCFFEFSHLKKHPFIFWSSTSRNEMAEIKRTWFLASSCSFLSNPKSLFICFQNRKEIALFYLIPHIHKVAKTNSPEKWWIWIGYSH